MERPMRNDFPEHSPRPEQVTGPDPPIVYQSSQMRAQINMSMSMTQEELEKLELEDALGSPGDRNKLLQLLPNVENPTAVLVMGNSIIYLAAAHGWWDIVRQLCTDYQFVPTDDEIDSSQHTILHKACQITTLADTETVMYLTANFCLDPLKEDIYGDRPIDLCQSSLRYGTKAETVATIQYLQKLVDDSKTEGFDSVVDFLKSKRKDVATMLAITEGVGDLSQDNIILQGCPGAGKSSLKRVMLGQDPLPREKHTTTDIIENAVRVVTTDKINRFAIIGNDELITMLADEVNNHHHNAIRKNLVQESSNQSMNIKTSAVLSIIERLDGATRPVKIYDSIWHHMVDLGGPPQFMDIVPLVYRCPSLNVVVVRLTEGLDDKPKVCFYEEGKDMYTMPDQLLLSNREMIIRMCQIAASCYASKGVVPCVMVVGTHLDRLWWFERARVLREFNQGLAEIKKKFSNVLICKSEDEIIFPINTMAKGKERQEYTRELQECIANVTKQHVSPVKVPLRWLVYQLDLDREGGVARMGYCYKSGDALGMKKTDVENALRFFSDMALILYFPDDIPDLVLTKLDPLIGKLSKLVKSSFIPPKFCPSAESERLRTKGLFNMSYLAKILNNVESNDLCDKEFLTILQCLRIAVCVSKDEYFLPSALSIEPIGEQSTFEMSSVPLVFTWGEHYLPHGFFFTVVVELLGKNGDYRFELLTDIAQWRQEIQVREATGKIAGVVKLTDRMKWIQVSSSSINIEEDCPTIYKEVNIAVQKSISRFQHTGIGPPIVTSLCPLCVNRDHYCLLSANKKEMTCIVNISKTDPATPVSKEMSCWFEAEESVPPLAPPRSPPTTDYLCVSASSSTVSSVSILPLVDDSTLLLDNDLVDVLDSVVDVSDWFSLGLALGLPHHELECIRQDGYDGYEEKGSLRKMVSLWLDTGTASWNNLVQALLDPLVSKKDIAQRICEQHPCV